MIKDKVIEWERQALMERNAGNIQEAIKLFEKIIKENQNYEFGMTFYDLACCLEDIGQLSEAEKNFQIALQYNSVDPIRWGGYASFLYLHGNPQEAFNTHLQLLALKKSNSNIENTSLVLKTFGKKNKFNGIRNNSQNK